MTIRRVCGLGVMLLGCCLSACGDDSAAGDTAGSSGAPGSAGASVAPGLAELGRACQPKYVPPGGFDPQEAYLESDNAACGDGACLVYRAEQVHCSCRCDGPSGQGPFCDCTDGFICVPVLEAGAPSLVGSYCVRNR